MFKDHHPGEVTFFTDPDKEAYEALSLVHGVGGVSGLGMLASGVRAWKKGYRQGRTKGDPLQQGGVFLIQKGGGAVFEQRSKTAGDHAEIDAVLESLKVLNGVEG